MTTRRLNYNNVELENAGDNNYFVAALLPPPPKPGLLILSFLALNVTLLMLSMKIEVTQSILAQGNIVSSTGIASVPANKSGILDKIYVTRGQRVKKGAILGEISEASGLSTPGDTSKERALRIADQLAKLYSIRELTLDVKEDNAAIALKRLKMQELQLQNQSDISDLITTQIRTTKKELKRKNSLYKRRLINYEEVESAELRLSQFSLRELETASDIIQLNDTIEQLGQGAQNSNIEFQQRLDDIDRAIVDLSDQSTQNQMVQRGLIFAPVAGQVTSINYFAGSSIPDLSVTLFEIDTDSTAPKKVEINLFVESKNVSKVSVGTIVDVEVSPLRVTSFGLFKGEVIETSMTTLSNEAKELYNYSSSVQDVFNVRVALTDQASRRLKSELKVRAGITVSGYIRGSRESIFQLLFRPILKALMVTFEVESETDQ